MHCAQYLGVVVVPLLGVLRAGGEVGVDEAQLGRADAHAHRHAALVAQWTGRVGNDGMASAVLISRCVVGGRVGRVRYARGSTDY